MCSKFFGRMDVKLCGDGLSLIALIELLPRGCTPYDCPAHVQTKFATPILYAIDNFEIYDIIYIHITIDNIFCIFF